MRKSWNAGRSGGSDRPVATTAIVAALVASFLIAFLISSSRPLLMAELLAFDPKLDKPWTLLTYPFYRDFASVLWFAFGCWIVYQFLSGIERSLREWGTAAFFFAVTFLGGLFYFLGTLIFGVSGILPSLNLPMYFVVFAWCLLHQQGQIMLFFCIPCPTRVLMWLCVAAVVIEYGWSNPPVGFVTVLPFALVWLYVTNRIPFMRFGAVPDLTSKKQEKKRDQGFDRFMGDVKRREQERAEKERLRKLFESSLDDEDKKDG